MEFVKQHWNRLLIVAISSLAIILAFSFTIDIKGKALIDESFTQAVVVFGSAKALNAVISLAQGTELDLPFVTVAIGQVLDPVNDLVEQFSLVMLASMASLGMQKILLSFATSTMYNVILGVSLVGLNIWLFVRFAKDERLRTLFFKVTVVVLFLRFAVPLIGYVNYVAYENFVKPEYNIEQLNTKIELVTDEVSRVNQETITQKEESSFFNKVAQTFDSSFYSKRVDAYKDAVDNASEYVIDLIIVFIFQTIFLPLLFLFVLYHLVKSIFNIGKA